jgi:hypothetical protein
MGRFIAGLTVLVALLAPSADAVAQESNDLDQFMRLVLARRDDNWRKLQQYVLDERERFLLLGPGNVRMFGLDREYTWYIRDGVFVRSPVRFDGAALSEQERRKYEDEWLARQKVRDAKEASASAASAAEGTLETGGDVINQLTREPQFVSAAYFLKFKFEPGRYAFAGPDTHDGARVLKIEYYPTRLYADDKDKEKQGSEATDEADRRERTDDEKAKEQELEARLEHQFNKVALITLWIEPEAHQIVKYEFQNVGLDFLPGRSLVRVDDIMASMEMGQPFPGVWLPRRIDGTGAVTLALGTFELRFDVDYTDYREAATGAKIR